MMRKIKYALAFLWGAIFSSSIWCLVLFDSGDLYEEVTPERLLWVLALVIVVLSAVAIAFSTVAFFVDHWNDD